MTDQDILADLESMKFQQSKQVECRTCLALWSLSPEVGKQVEDAVYAKALTQKSAKELLEKHTVYRFGNTTLGAHFRKGHTI